ncbi:MAG: type II secretion system protein [Elusimicrobia bacterium]|nr:type II secretion system protein [Elusimicrobiota bacterium]
MRARPGYTLVEVVVAMLLAAVMITAVFTVALSSKRSSLKQDSQHMAQASAQGLLKTLSAYITADWTITDPPGPTPYNAGAAKWSLHNALHVTDSHPQGGTWALMPGSHTLVGIAGGQEPDGFLLRLRGSPYFGTVTYCVQWIGCGQCTNNANCAPSTCTAPLGPSCQPTISVKMDWTQP